MRKKHSLNGVTEEQKKKRQPYPVGAIPPKLCRKCKKTWDYVTYRDVDREGDPWEYLEDFPKRGCTKMQCPQCKQAGSSSS